MVNENPDKKRHEKTDYYLPRTKTTPPAPVCQEIPRLSILNPLQQDSAAKLWLLLAPAGYGKTTAMRQMLQVLCEQGFIGLWLNLDDADNDMSRFLTSFATVIAPHFPPLKVALGRRSTNEELAYLIIESLHEITHSTVIFFDNFEVLRNSAVCGLIARGIEALPDHCRVVIASRNKPEIGISRLITRRQVHQFDASSMLFSADETRQFMENQSSILSNTQIQILQARTGGWPAALQLAAIALHGRVDADSVIANFSGSNAAICAFLAEEVLHSLPAATQEFLLHSSILEELNPSACDNILRRNDSLDILLELNQRHLFLLASDEHAETFRFHNLFRDFLLVLLQRRQPAKVNELHARACQVYLAMDRPIPAIRHALKSDMNTAIGLLLQYADALLGKGRIGLLTQLIDQIPTRYLEQFPHLRLIYALCLTYTRGPHVAYNLIKYIDESHLPAESATYLLALRPMQLAMMDRITEAHKYGILAESYNKMHPQAATAIVQVTLAQALTQTCIILGEYEQAHYFCDQARSIQRPSWDNFNQIVADTAETTMDLLRGNLLLAAQRMALCMNLLQSTQDNTRRGIAMASILYAEVLYEQDRCAEAKKLLITNSALIQEIGPPDTLINAHVLLSRIMASENDYDTALQLLIELEQSGHRLQIPRVIASARLERAGLFLSRGDSAGAAEQLALARRTVDWNDINKLWFPANDVLSADIIEIRLGIVTGNLEQILPLLRALVKRADREQRGRRGLKLKILLAQVLFAKGQHNAAFRALAEALSIAEAGGFIRTFLEEGSAMGSLLREAQQVGESIYARQLEGRLGVFVPCTTGSGENTEILTGKEMNVLKLLALGHTNIAIAGKLYVSESTVRTHLRNINLKLHAGNRTEAVSIARKLGLLA